VDEDFDLFAHVELEAEKVEQEEEYEDGGEPEAKAAVQLFKRTLPRVHNSWVGLSPNAPDFISRINTDFDDGLDEISDHFERWSKHEDMKKYADALEEWDD